ncbi:substrate-binding periplasmic protein [Undibacterium oligocarboniphilum]|nr:transporter substrate-binding domain-containing protein [Undibacterium oligocarboniphilum]MBC3869584.1 transporter substrate-binding domain-containing protein [Undibacterium oligocarboniphilum]
MWNVWRDCLLSLTLILSTTAAGAHCSRPITVPVAPTGFSVIINGDIISGIYPELLTSLSSKEKCEFVITPVPRARLEMMFDNGQADILIPAARTPRRDQSGIFIPLIYYRAMLIAVHPQQNPPQNFKELLDQTSVRLSVVRGFDYGEGYQSLISELQKQGRLRIEADPVSVARILKSGAADYTLMTPSIFAGTVLSDARVGDMMNKLEYISLAELPWSDSGVYLSRKSLRAEDLAALTEMFERVGNSGLVWKGFQRYYKKEVLKESIRPR